MQILRLLLFVLPLGLDTLGVSISLGIKSSFQEPAHQHRWLWSALLFSMAEMLMPLIGLVIGFVASFFISDIMHYVGSLLLIGVGVWELQEEVREVLSKRRKRFENSLKSTTLSQNTMAVPMVSSRFDWRQQLLLALSISLDELAIGFSLGTITIGPAGSKTISTLWLCALIGLQGFLMTLLGLALGRALQIRLKPVKEWSELLSAFLLIGLGIWLLVT